MIRKNKKINRKKARRKKSKYSKADIDQSYDEFFHKTNMSMTYDGRFRDPSSGNKQNDMFLSFDGTFNQKYQTKITYDRDERTLVQKKFDQYLEGMNYQFSHLVKGSDKNQVRTISQIQNQQRVDKENKLNKIRRKLQRFKKKRDQEILNIDSKSFLKPSNLFQSNPRYRNRLCMVNKSSRIFKIHKNNLKGLKHIGDNNDDLDLFKMINNK